MDKSWIIMPRNSHVYAQGVRDFIEFAFQNSSVNDMILCPCPRCGFCKRQTRAEIYDHLICKQFPKGYTIWYLHGEPHAQQTNYASTSVEAASTSNVVGEDQIRDMVNDAFGVHEHQLEEDFHILADEARQTDEATPNVHQTRSTSDEFYELSNDGQQPLYEGCANYTKLSFLLKLYHIKCLCGMSDKAMTMILELLHDAFPNIKIPSSFYDAKKNITKLGLNYEKIHACPNNCMLYWGNEEDEKRDTCKVCNVSRWKEKKGGSNVASSGKKSRKNIPAKQPSEIPLDQWVAFVDYRARPETKAKSEQNIRNRSNQTMPHTLGSKSFARLQKEMETQLGRVVTRAELFQVSHTTSEGSFVNEEARRNHEDLVIRSQSSSENEAFSSIFGKEHPGYVRGMGLGVVPTQVYGSSSNSGSRRNDSEGERHEVEALRAEVGRLTQQAEDREQRYERLARENDERYQRLAQENEQRYQQFQQLQQQLAYLNQHLPSRNQYIAPNQENVVSPAIGRRSSHDSHSARGEGNSDHSA